MTTEDRKKQLERIKEILTYSLECLELKSEMVETENRIELDITSDTLPMLHASIGAAWGRDDRLRVYLKDRYTVYCSSYNPNRTDTLSYNFCHMLPDAELEKIGIPKKDYERSVRFLAYEFKADKNPKLIVRDFEKVIVIYKQLVEAAESKVKERMATDTATTVLLNKVSKACGYQQAYNVPTRATFRHKSIGSITVYEYGTVEVTSQVSHEDLLKRLGID